MLETVSDIAQKCLLQLIVLVVFVPTIVKIFDKIDEKRMRQYHQMMERDEEWRRKHSGRSGKASKSRHSTKS